MPIKISLKSKDKYRLTVAPGSIYQEEKKLISDLPVKQVVWEYSTRHKCDMFTHWEVPRVDVQEILRRWEDEDIDADTNFWRDVRILNKYERSLVDGMGLYTGHVDFSRPPIDKQQEAYVRTNPKWFRMVNSFGTGRGKTWSTLERAKFMGTKRMVVVTILNMIDDWIEEIFLTFGVQAAVYQGPKRKSMDLSGEKFVITTYQLAHELEYPEPPNHFDQFIFDEADMAINPTTKTWKNIQYILDTHTWKVPGINVQPATATPGNNKTEGFWTPLYMVHPYLAGTTQGFRNRHQRVESWKDQVVQRVLPDGRVVFRTVKVANRVVAQNKVELQGKLNAAIIRDSKDTRFPFEQEVKIIDCPLTDAQRRVFQTIKNKSIIEMDAKEWDFSKLKNVIIKLMQCCEGLHHFESENNESSKLKVIRQTLNKCIKEGRKCALWFSYRAGLDILAEQYMDYGVPYHGGMNREQKQLAKWAFCGCTERELPTFEALAKKHNFRMRPGEALFFFGIMSKSTSRGLNLHKMCAFQIFVNVHPGAPTMTQTYGRIVRIGQTAPKVTTWYLLSNSQTEHLWFEIVVGKQKDNIALLDGKESINGAQIKKLWRELKRDKLEGGLLR